MIYRTKRRFRYIGFTMLLLSFIAYFCYHAISGERGLLALVQFEKKLAKRQAQLDELQAERFRLEYRVKLLQSESLDLDLLDEQARKQLGYAKPDEQVFIKDQ